MNIFWHQITHTHTHIFHLSFPSLSLSSIPGLIPGSQFHFVELFFFGFNIEIEISNYVSRPFPSLIRTLVFCVHRMTATFVADGNRRCWSDLIAHTCCAGIPLSVSIIIIRGYSTRDDSMPLAFDVPSPATVTSPFRVIFNLGYTRSHSLNACARNSNMRFLVSVLMSVVASESSSRARVKREKQKTKTECQNWYIYIVDN